MTERNEVMWNQMNLILNTASIEYQREIERRTRLENKALSYVTFVSIVIAASIAIGISMFTLFDLDSIWKFIYFIACLVTIFYSLLALLHSLISLRMKILCNLDLDEVQGLWHEEEVEVVAGSIFRSIKSAVSENMTLNKKVEYRNSLSYLFIWISVVSFIFQIGILFITTLRGA